MAMQRLVSTSLASLRPSGPASERDYHYLTSYLVETRAFGQSFATMFAEPIYVKGGDVVDWYCEAGGATPVLVSSLPDDERERVLALVEGRLNTLRQQGERLKARGERIGATLLAAATVPQPLADFAYWIADSNPENPDRGRAVLVTWGFISDGPRRTVGAIVGTRSRIDDAAQNVVVPTPSGALAVPDGVTDGGTSSRLVDGANSTGDAPLGAAISSNRHTIYEKITREAVLVERRPFHAGWLLWPLFAVLLLAIGALLLRGCGIGIPSFGFFNLPVLSYCSGPGSIAAAPSDRALLLRSLARDLEVQLVQRDAQCLAQLQTPQRSTPQSADPPVPPAGEIQKRLDREQAQNGEVQVTLAWDGPPDLDLSVVCPAGETIFFRIRQNCGGSLDVDMNSSERQSMTPVEHISWPTGAAPRGTFQVRVNLYALNDDTRPSIPFVVEVRNGQDVKTYPGSVTPGGNTLVIVTSFNR